MIPIKLHPDNCHACSDDKRKQESDELENMETNLAEMCDHASEKQVNGNESGETDERQNDGKNVKRRNENQRRGGLTTALKSSRLARRHRQSRTLYHAKNTPH